MFLAHKISYAKWKKCLDSPVDDISADAITIDLRTQGNTLSFWFCGDDDATKEALDAAALAISTEMDKASTIYLIYLKKESLETDGYRVAQTNGATKITDLVHLHYDVCDLNFNLLGDMAQRVQQAISKTQMHQVVRGDLLKMAVTATREGRLDPTKLKPTFQSEVESKISP